MQRNLNPKNKRAPKSNFVMRIGRRKGRKIITKEKGNRRSRIEIMNTEETTDGIAQKTIVRRSKTNQNENTKRKMLITDTEMRI